jgi:hypothetical protein
MLIHHASKMPAEKADSHTNKILKSVSETYLRECVEKISIPRHFQAQPENNQWVVHWILLQLQSYGYQMQSQEIFAN